jgi:hypothetical protein
LLFGKDSPVQVGLGFSADNDDLTWFKNAWLSGLIFQVTVMCPSDFVELNEDLALSFQDRVH